MVVCPRYNCAPQVTLEDKGNPDLNSGLDKAAVWHSFAGLKQQVGHQNAAFAVLRRCRSLYQSPPGRSDCLRPASGSQTCRTDRARSCRRSGSECRAGSAPGLAEAAQGAWQDWLQSLSPTFCSEVFGQIIVDRRGFRRKFRADVAYFHGQNKRGLAEDFAAIRRGGREKRRDSGFARVKTAPTSHPYANVDKAMLRVPVGNHPMIRAHRPDPGLPKAGPPSPPPHSAARCKDPEWGCGFQDWPNSRS